MIDLDITVERPADEIELDISTSSQELELTFEGGISSNYNDLFNKPKINGVTVQGDKQSIDYRLQDTMHELTVQEIERILYLD